MLVLCCPRNRFLQLLVALQEHGSVLFAGLGRREADPMEWFVRPPFGARSEHSSEREVLSVSLSSVWPPPPLTVGTSAHLYLGAGAHEGRTAAFIQDGGSTLSLDALRLPGPGMHTIPLSTASPTASHLPSDLEPWSRTIGALGGETVWRRLVHLSVAVVGCGRTGSLVATTLARLGLRRLVLIDPDVVEAHVTEMDLIDCEDVGRGKAEALASHLARLAPTSEIVPVTASIDDLAGFASVRGVDLMFSCVDNDRSRFVCGLLAALYVKILIDIGTGVFSDTREGPTVGVDLTTQRMGADVRLVIPGERCLLCVGRLANYERAVQELLDPMVVTAVPWHHQRAGSLRTLNSMAAGLAVQALLDLVAERLTGSLWAQLDFNQQGQLAVRYPPLTAGTADCGLCARTGLGDHSALGLWSRRETSLP